MPNNSITFSRFRPLLVCLIGFLLLPGIAPAQTIPETPEASEGDTNPLPSHIAIRVESETIPMEVFQQRVDGLLAQYEEKARKQGKEYDRADIRERISNRIKRKMISRLLVEVHSRRDGMTVPSEKLRTTWNRTLKNAGGREAYRKKVQERGMTLQDAKEQVRVRLRRREYIKKNIPNITVTDTEIKKVYMNHRKRFSRVGRKRATQFIRQRILRKKENQASRIFIGKLKKKSLVQSNV